MSRISSMNVSLPGELRRWVDRVVKSNGYGSASEYVRELVRGDRERRAKASLEALMLEGLASGEPVEVTDEWWARKRAELVRRARKANRG